MKTVKLLVSLYLLSALFQTVSGQEHHQQQHHHHNHMHIDYKKRDEWQQPKKILKIIGVEKNMKIGEIGAGEGYFTFYLSGKVGKKGEIYANDICEEQFEAIQEKCKKTKIKNIRNIKGTPESPGFNKNLKLDMIVMMHSYHYIEKPREYLKVLSKHLKPNGKIAIIHWESEKIKQKPLKYSKQNILESIKDTEFELEKTDESLLYDNIYILKLNKI